jgi:branched-chain amino acid transport system permease protein
MNIWRRSAIGLTLFLTAAIFIVAVSRADIQDFAVLSFYWLLLAASWNLLAGFGGQFSFAHLALALCGGYFSVFCERMLDISSLLTLPLAGLATALVGFGLGLVSLRVRGVYLSLITFGFAGAFSVWATADWERTRGYAGLNSDIFFMGGDSRPFLFLGLALVTLYFTCQSQLLVSGFGLQAMAVRDREAVAEGLGVRTARVKVAMFTYTAFWAGVAGSYYAGYVGTVSPSVAELIWMGWAVTTVVVGGLGTSLGPIAGVLLVRSLDFLIRSIGSEYETVMIASLLVIFMFLAPNGLAGLAESARTRIHPAHQRWRETTAPLRRSSKPGVTDSALASPANADQSLTPSPMDKEET